MASPVFLPTAVVIYTLQASNRIILPLICSKNSNNHNNMASPVFLPTAVVIYTLQASNRIILLLICSNTTTNRWCIQLGLRWHSQRAVSPPLITPMKDLPGFEQQQQNPNSNLQQQPQCHHQQQQMANQGVAAMVSPESTFSSLEHPHQRNLHTMAKQGTETEGLKPEEDKASSRTRTSSGDGAKTFENKLQWEAAMREEEAEILAQMHAGIPVLSMAYEEDMRRIQNNNMSKEKPNEEDDRRQKE